MYLCVCLVSSRLLPSSPTDKQAGVVWPTEPWVLLFAQQMQSGWCRNGCCRLICGWTLSCPSPQHQTLSALPADVPGLVWTSTHWRPLGKVAAIASCDSSSQCCLHALSWHLPGTACWLRVGGIDECTASRRAGALTAPCLESVRAESLLTAAGVMCVGVPACALRKAQWSFLIPTAWGTFLGLSNVLRRHAHHGGLLLHPGWCCVPPLSRCVHGAGIWVGATCCGVGAGPWCWVCWVAAGGRQVGWPRGYKSRANGNWGVGTCEAFHVKPVVVWVLVARYRFPSASPARCVSWCAVCFACRLSACVPLFPLLQRLYSLHMLCSRNKVGCEGVVSPLPPVPPAWGVVPFPSVRLPACLLVFYAVCVCRVGPLSCCRGVRSVS